MKQIQNVSIILQWAYLFYGFGIPRIQLTYFNPLLHWRFFVDRNGKIVLDQFPKVHVWRTQARITWQIKLEI